MTKLVYLFSTLILTLLVAAYISFPLEAKSKRPVASNKSSAARHPEAKLETDIRFNSTTVHGRYQSATEALVKVDNEKIHSPLLGLRPHFKDRIEVPPGGLQ